MAGTNRNPEVIAQRAIVGVFAIVALVAGVIGVTSCTVGLIATGHPILIVGIIGSAAGIVAGLYFARLAMSPPRGL
jgi:hypothetical protein